MQYIYKYFLVRASAKAAADDRLRGRTELIIIIMGIVTSCVYFTFKLMAESLAEKGR